MPIEVLTLLIKGQVVLPNELRKEFSLALDDKFIAYWSNGSIVLKKLELPEANDFEKEIDETVKFAKETNMTEDDINNVIKEYRLEKKNK